MRLTSIALLLLIAAAPAAGRAVVVVAADLERYRPLVRFLGWPSP